MSNSTHSTIYQNHLKSQLTTAQYLLFSLLVTVLQLVKNVRFETLAASLPLPIMFESRPMMSIS
uniref:Uncharacterized protein n=1 Tax=Moorena producens (strain JHB) TaxID=1454205 RepID=A0A1D9GAD6_MOOP1